MRVSTSLAVLTAFIVFNVFFVPWGDPNIELKSGTVAGKLVLQESRYSSCPKIGMKFDDGTQADICVTIATYASLDVGDRASFSVKKPFDTLKFLAVVFGLVGLVFSVITLIFNLLFGIT